MENYSNGKSLCIRDTFHMLDIR